MYVSIFKLRISDRAAIIYLDTVPDHRIFTRTQNLEVTQNFGLALGSFKDGK